MASARKWLRRAAIALGLGAAALLTVGWTYEHAAEAADAKLKPPGVLVAVGQRRMHLVCAGAGSPTVILEPGAGEFSLLVAPLQSRIAAFTRVCAYDRAGYAWSDPAPEGRSFDARAADLAALLRGAGVTGPYVMVGSSYGGLLARSFVRAEPGEVAGVVLVDAAEEQLVFSHLPLFRGARAAQRGQAVVAEFGVMRLAMAQLAARAKADGRLPADATADEVAAAVAFSGRPSAFRVAADEDSAFDDTPLVERAPGGFGGLGDRPLLVIRHGQPFSGINAPLAVLEPEWPAAQTRLAALSTDSRTIVATRNGHDVAVENPALVADAVRTVVQAVRDGSRL
jgi:pimeloyl-ACP methyl ester carboxylesterase